MESREVVVIGSGPAALRAAIACSDGGVVPLIIDELGFGSGAGSPPVAGLAASIDELNSQSHMDDTIAAGGEFCNESVVSRTCNEGVSTLAELERWGLGWGFRLKFTYWETEKKTESEGRILCKE